MKRILLVMLTLITVISCEKNVIGDFEGQAAEAVIPEQESLRQRSYHLAKPANGRASYDLHAI